MPFLQLGGDEASEEPAAKEGAEDEGKAGRGCRHGILAVTQLLPFAMRFLAPNSSKQSHKATKRSLN